VLHLAHDLGASRLPFGEVPHEWRGDVSVGAMLRVYHFDASFP